MVKELKQMNLFDESMDSVHFIKQDYVMVHDSNLLSMLSTSTGLKQIENEIGNSYFKGDRVMISFSSIEDDTETFLWITHYYQHLKGKVGVIKEVLPYKKLQYIEEYDIKNEDNRIVMYHCYLDYVV